MLTKTIDILESAADAVCQHQQKWDPALREWCQREQDLSEAFFQQHQSNPALRRQVLRLLDTQGNVEALKRELYFRLGLKMGMELGILNVIPLE